MRHLRFAVLLPTLCAGCSRFVWHEDPFTPDDAPVSEVLVNGTDTTYVLRGSSYYLLARQRSVLWDREVLDDVVWKYRSLFGDTPPVIAVRVDSARVPLDSTSTWRGLPVSTVAAMRRSMDSSSAGRASRDRDVPISADDSARARLITQRMLATTAAEAWLRARTLEVGRAAATQPGGPSGSAVPQATLPAWIEAGAVRILGSNGAPDRAVAQLRADGTQILPLAQLFAFSWPARPNVTELAQPDGWRELEGGDASELTRGRGRMKRGARASSLVIAEAVSILAFLHERDAALVGRLADELARGRPMAEVLATSATLPHDVDALDAQWRDWMKKYGR